MLPRFGDANLSLEDQCRSVLQLLLYPCEEADAFNGDFRCCPNCDGPAESLSSPYCSETCRGQAAFVRQLRGALATGLILEAEKQQVFGERLWWLLGGGLPLRESRIPESVKRQVTKRSEGKCEFCGAPMTRVENVGSGCNRPFNLRAVCSDCSKTKSYGDLEFSGSAPVVALLGDFSRRINSEKPLRPCDDPHDWNWRAFVTRRQQITGNAQKD